VGILHLGWHSCFSNNGAGWSGGGDDTVDGASNGGTAVVFHIFF
jgi:hypothetical protein